MHPLLRRTGARVREAGKRLGGAAVGALTIAMLRTTRYFDPVKTANLFARVTRRIGPLLPEQRIGRANLTAAFPEKSPEEIEAILAGVWDNLGRLGAEFAHIDHIWDYDPARPEKSRIEIAPRVCLIATTAKLSKLQPEGGELSDVVVELIDTSLDGLHAVELDRILGRVGHTKGIQLEVIAKLRHRGAQRN